LEVWGKISVSFPLNMVRILSIIIKRGKKEEIVDFLPYIY